MVGENYETIWTENLRAARRKAGLTQATLAAAAGVSQQAVALLERGYGSSPQTRGAIAAALDKRPSELFPPRGASDGAAGRPEAPAQGSGPSASGGVFRWTTNASQEAVRAATKWTQRAAPRRWKVRQP